MSDTLSAWAMTMRCFRPTFRRNRKNTSDAADIKPRPPISIRLMMTIWPKPLHWVQVSYSTRPVTQVAEVAVNRAGRKPQLTPERDAMGSVSRSAPSRMMSAKAMAMILVGLRALECFTW